MTNLQTLLHALTAQQAPAGQPGCAGGLVGLTPFLLMFLIIYFLLIRPQRKQQQKHQQLLDNLKKGDEVVTQGGVIGRIYAVTDRVVTLEVARDVKVRVLKRQIAGLYAEGEVPAEAAPEKK